MQTDGQKMRPTKDMEIDHPQWLSIPSELEPGPAHPRISKRQLKRWQLVLESRNIPSRAEKVDRHWQLLVPASAYRDACRELLTYERENQGWPPPPPQARKQHENTASSLWVLILLVVFYNLTSHHFNPLDSSPLDWTALGNAHSEKILDGEWWRLITALTLHSGPLHLLGNIAVGGLFMIRLCWLLGSGYAWLGALTSGFLGNFLNALVQSPDHRSIGASTAVFGAIGLLATINMLHYRHSLQRRWPIPVAAACGLLALLGTGGENTDIGAHLFGFIAGIGLGTFAGFQLQQRENIHPSLNRVAAVLSCALVAGAWWKALS